MLFSQQLQKTAVVSGVGPAASIIISSISSRISSWISSRISDGIAAV
jgi:hypothetical protein